jgi:DNA repair protein SbcD/Mre11
MGDLAAGGLSASGCIEAPFGAGRGKNGVGILCNDCAFGKARQVLASFHGAGENKFDPRKTGKDKLPKKRHAQSGCDIALSPLPDIFQEHRQQRVKMVRFLHIADVHLDTLFAGRSVTTRRVLRSAVQDAFRNAVDFAIREKLHAVLIAGDLFDSERLHFTTERFLTQQFTRLAEAGIRCFYCSGNHDPTPVLVRPPWAGACVIFSEGEPRIEELRDTSGELVARIVGAGHTSARVGMNLAADFPMAGKHVPHIALLHAHVAGVRSVGDHERYAPCAISDFAGKGYAYWALGHIHIRQQVCAASNAWYSGNIQGRSQREVGLRGGLLVEVDGRSTPRVTPVDFAPVVWVRVNVNRLQDVDSYEALRQRVETAFRLEAGNAAGRCMVRLVLAGPCPMYQRLRDEESRQGMAEELAQDLGALEVELRCDEVTAPIDLAVVREETTVLAEVLSLLEEAATDDEALRIIIPEHLAGLPADTSPEIYVRTLLRGLDHEAALRLLAKY